MITVEIVGFCAGILVAASLMPQVIKSWKTKSTSDISITWMIINILGQILWIFYGVLITSLSLIIMSSITLAFSVFLLVLKIRYK